MDFPRTSSRLWSANRLRSNKWSISWQSRTRAIVSQLMPAYLYLSGWRSKYRNSTKSLSVIRKRETCTRLRIWYSTTSSPLKNTDHRKFHLLKQNNCLNRFWSKRSKCNRPSRDSLKWLKLSSVSMKSNTEPLRIGYWLQPTNCRKWYSKMPTNTSLKLIQ